MIACRIFVTILGIYVFIRGIFKPELLEVELEDIRRDGYDRVAVGFINYWGLIIAWRSCCISGLSIIVGSWLYGNLSVQWLLILLGCAVSPVVIVICMLFIMAFIDLIFGAP